MRIVTEPRPLGSGFRFRTHRQQLLSRGVPDKIFRPFQRVGFPSQVFGHGLISLGQILFNYMPTRERIEKLADAASPDLGMQPSVNLFRNGDG